MKNPVAKSRSLSAMSTKRLCVAALFMAMNIAMSSFSVPVPGGHLYLNDAVIVMASILLDPVSAFMVGGVGAFLGDVFFYPAAMFVSLVVHGVQAVAVSLLSHHLPGKRPAVASSIGAAVGAVIMVVGYTFGRAFFYGTPAASIAKLPYQILQAAVGAVLGIMLCYPFGVIRLAKRYGIIPKETAKGAQKETPKGAE